MTTPSETTLSAENALANDLYVAVVNADLTWWDDLTPEMQEGWRRGARLLAARSQPATEGLRAAASVLLTTARTVMPEKVPCGHDRRWLLGLLDDLRAALAATESAGDERT